MSTHDPVFKKKLLLAIKKTQGTLAKVTQMIEEDAYCANVGQQINAAIGLLKSANVDLMKSHLMCCGKSALSHKNPKEGEKFIEEFSRIWDVSTRK